MGVNENGEMGIFFVEKTRVTKNCNDNILPEVPHSVCTNLRPQTADRNPLHMARSLAWQPFRFRIAKK